jgi:hypothetical protein
MLNGYTTSLQYWNNVEMTSQNCINIATMLQMLQLCCASPGLAHAFKDEKVNVRIHFANRCRYATNICNIFHYKTISTHSYARIINIVFIMKQFQPTIILVGLPPTSAIFFISNDFNLQLCPLYFRDKSSQHTLTRSHKKMSATKKGAY